jgi:hypothetical protein
VPVFGLRAAGSRTLIITNQLILNKCGRRERKRKRDDEELRQPIVERPADEKACVFLMKHISAFYAL